MLRPVLLAAPLTLALGSNPNADAKGSASDDDRTQLANQGANSGEEVVSQDVV